ncbi:hypothetical protein [Rhodococcoides kroppenstedtii]|uniref:hypothetical protein n=1 Tax=Rhodococcoides kroppenstedtii TaxID=293050 RepID=UPI000AE7C8D5|nr:hypothetical protein [Rhodococcus kroppenstedtii]
MTRRTFRVGEYIQRAHRLAQQKCVRRRAAAPPRRRAAARGVAGLQNESSVSG